MKVTSCMRSKQSVGADKGPLRWVKGSRSAALIVSLSRLLADMMMEDLMSFGEHGSLC